MPSAAVSQGAIGRARRKVPLAAVLFVVLLDACTETPYSFFQVPPPPSTDSDSDSGSDSSSDSGTGSGNAPGAGGSLPPPAASGGEEGDPPLGQGGDGAVAPPRCESRIDPERETVRLSLVASGHCVAMGAYAPLFGGESYLVDLSDCSGDVLQLWTVLEMESGARVFQSEASGFNLDVRFSSPESGTPTVLYTAHMNYNQRFSPLPVSGGFKLSPLHALDKCLSERDGALALWPCDDLAEDQKFSLLSCED